MIYEINDKYYVNVAPHIFSEVKITFKNNNLILVSIDNTIEVYNMSGVKQINVNTEKESLKKKFASTTKTSHKDTTRKYNYDKY